MPHCLLEYSNNIVDQPDFRELLMQINEFLTETGLFDLADIKSRAVCHDQFVIGDGAADRAFVTVNFSMLSGRDDATKKRLSDGILKRLEQAFPKTLAERRCSLTVRITDMDRGCYGKTISYED